MCALASRLHWVFHDWVKWHSETALDWHLCWTPQHPMWHQRNISKKIGRLCTHLGHLGNFWPLQGHFRALWPCVWAARLCLGSNPCQGALDTVSRALELALDPILIQGGILTFCEGCLQGSAPPQFATPRAPAKQQRREKITVSLGAPITTGLGAAMQTAAQ